MMLDLSILIVTWNQKELVEKCLRSIFTSSPKIQFEVIVVDNASTDGTQDMIHQQFPEVVLIQNDKNIGYGPAHNRAFHVSRGRCLLVLNNDVTMTPGTLEGMMDYIDKHPDVGLVGGQSRFPSGAFQPSANHRFPNLWDVFFEEIFFSKSLKYTFLKTRFGASCSALLWNLNQPHSVAWVGGACMLVRRRAVDQVGFFDEHFFFYREDCDFCLRLKEAGWKVVYDPRYFFIHERGASTQKNARKVTLESRRSLLYYFLKHKGRFGFWMAKCILLSGLWLRYFLFSMSGVLGKKDKGRLHLLKEMISIFGKMKDPSLEFQSD